MGQGKKTAEELRAIFDDDTLKAADKYRDKLRVVDGAIRKLREGIETIMAPLGALDSGMSDNADKVEAFNDGILATADNLARAAQILNADAGGAFRARAETIVATNNELSNLGKQLDSETASIRGTREGFFKLASTFGENYEQSQNLRMGLGELAEDIST